MCGIGGGEEGESLRKGVGRRNRRSEREEGRFDAQWVLHSHH